jgi:N-acetylneuraminate synthase
MLNFENLESVYLIAEIGINHNGNIDLARRLIDASSAVGWDCVKFQKRNPDVCVPEAQKLVPKSTPWGDMTYLDYKKKIEFEKKEYDYINSYCSSKVPKLEWTASVWDLDSLKFICGYDVPFIKIPSAMITDLELLRETSKSKKPIILSTGMSTIEEVDEAVNEVVKYGNKPCILHSNSCYPAPVEDLNLSVIPLFKKRYGCIIGYSGHEYSVEPSVIAVALGAKVIERHVTIDHNLWGTDQKASLTITGMDRLYNRIKDVDVMMGKPEKKVTDGEIEIRKKLRKNI